MDVKYVNPFIESFNSVMPQLGFSEVRTGNLSVKIKEVVTTGVLIIVGVVGNIKGNVIYRLDMENAKNIASIMMMGMPVEDFDDMAQSALSELTNMLTANAATFFASMDVKIDISTPTLLHGENLSVKTNTEKILCIELLADNIPVEINISFE